MLTQAYKDYIKSPAWNRIRLQRLALDNYICQACKVKKATEVHHRTYIHLYHEKLEDLISVCHRCHKIITRANKKK